VSTSAKKHEHIYPGYSTCQTVIAIRDLSSSHPSSLLVRQEFTPSHNHRHNGKTI
jgi:hypothetical protein